MRVLLGVIFFLFVHAPAEATYKIICAPGALSSEWSGVIWQYSSYGGKLRQVVIIDVEALGAQGKLVECRRERGAVTGGIDKSCKFAVGVPFKTTYYKTIRHETCVTGNDLNTEECVVECADKK
ncbi:MAG: hypothetical protein AB7T86_03285 [Xanthobacteraceae bacterium]|uniref:hypothetical protein n=1 Tax=Pseudolabrys sp. TaxID=1960880 RepID=UPI003D0A42AC